MIRKVLTSLCLMLTLCFPVSGSSTELTATDTVATDEVAEDSACAKPLNINGVKKDELDEAFDHIKDCATPERKLVVYISGPGGDINDALAFYDRMHISGLSKQVRFISDGYIASASNIIWLSSHERVVAPMTMFVLHKMNVDFPQETSQFEVDFTVIAVKLTRAAVRRVTNENAAQLWASASQDHEGAIVFDAKEALRLGWATELLKYE